VNPNLHFDYTTLGHVTIDVMPDGSRRPGGTAFYGALQAARLGRRTLIVTRGAAPEIDELLAPYSAELAFEVLPAPATTTLATSGSGTERTQRMLAWAGPLPEDLRLDTAILHLAPVARELPTRWLGEASFVGLTPQGLARRWAGAGEELSLVEPSDTAVALAQRCDAIVISEHEQASCARLLARATDAGAIVAVTAGGDPNRILLTDGRALELDVPPIEEPHEDLGAGDVFAAAFFVALAEGRAVQHAVAFANAAAAVRMQGSGADAIGGRAAIEARQRAAASAG